MKNKFNYDKLTAEQLQSLYNLTGHLASPSDEEQLLQLILSDLIKETGAEVGAFIYYDKSKDRFIPRTIRTDDNRKTEDVEFSQTVFREVLENKEAVLTFDTRTDEKYSGKQSVIINKIYAILAFPLIIKNEVYGILYFDSRKNRQHYNESARQFLSFFSVIASLTLEQVLIKKEVESENLLLKSKLDDDARIPTMIGESAPMKKLFRLITKVARSDASVIISGENGTGKDLAARAVHDLSPRKEKPFTAQYIGNIPGTILDSELFGYKKGAFTGANADKPGLFEAVDGGTLFLDEIGDLAPELQTKLLRVLQNKEIKRLGENTVRYVDVRIVTATNQDLASLVQEGKFREDLYYRLNVINIKVPPLRERKSDIPLLTEYFLQKENSTKNLHLSKEAMRKLMDFNWPGNVRQLENIIKRILILTAGDEITGDDIRFDDMPSDRIDNSFNGTMEEIKNTIITSRIKTFNGNKTRAAKSLDISLRSLQAKAKELGL